jgi:hypothetical protein
MERTYEIELTHDEMSNIIHALQITIDTAVRVGDEVTRQQVQAIKDSFGEKILVSTDVTAEQDVKPTLTPAIAQALLVETGKAMDAWYAAPTPDLHYVRLEQGRDRLKAAMGS